MTGISGNKGREWGNSLEAEKGEIYCGIINILNKITSSLSIDHVDWGPIANSAIMNGAGPGEHARRH